MEKKDIKQFLHLYHGCQVQTPTRHYSADGGKSFKVIGRLMEIDLVIDQGGVHLPGNRIEDLEMYPLGDLKPLLRPLASMTEEEAWEFVGGKSTLYDDLKISKQDKTGIEISYTIDAGEEGCYPQLYKVDFYAFTPKSFQWLLSKGFDLFNLIPEGLAIDSTLKPV